MSGWTNGIGWWKTCWSVGSFHAGGRGSTEGSFIISGAAGESGDLYKVFARGTNGDYHEAGRFSFCARRMRRNSCTPTNHKETDNP